MFTEICNTHRISPKKTVVFLIIIACILLLTNVLQISLCYVKFYRHENLFTVYKDKLLHNEDIYIYIDNENFKELNEIDVEILKKEGDIIYFQLFSNIKFGWGVAFDEKTDLKDKSNISWAFEIKKNWYIYQES